MRASETSAPRPGRPLLAVDTGSPVVSVALISRANGADPAGVLAQRTLEQMETSRHLLGALRDALRESDIALADLGGLVALAGPGSFTGLRIGLATLYGLHQGTGLPATAVPTLETLAFQELRDRQDSGDAAAEPRILAAVDALRGDWFVQGFEGQGDTLEATSEATRRPVAEILQNLTESPARVVGFRLVGDNTHEPEPLAAAAGQWALHTAARGRRWDPLSLTRPLYLRAPNVRRPGS